MLKKIYNHNLTKKYLNGNNQLFDGMFTLFKIGTVLFIALQIYGIAIPECQYYGNYTEECFITTLQNSVSPIILAMICFVFGYVVGHINKDQ